MPNYYPLFILTAALLMLTPGPNVALIVANSVAYGTRHGLMTVAGSVAAAIVHLTIVGIGLGSALTIAGTAFEWLRWVGAAYLLLLGLRTWLTPPADLGQVQARPVPVRAMVVRALLVGLTNPKTLLFYGALLPQFITPDRAIGPQLWVLSLTFVAVAIAVDSGWAVAAGRARRLLSRHGRLRQRVSGGLLMGAGLGLALVRAR